MCQMIHEFLVRQVIGITEANMLRDRRPAPSLTPFCHTEYFDNFVALGTEVDEVRHRACQAEAAQQGAGLPTHPVTASFGASCLGWQFDPAVAIAGVSARGRWRLRLGRPSRCCLREGAA